MKRAWIALLSVSLAAPLCSSAAEQLIPAGSLIQCTISEPHLNSKTTAAGDPVLCQVGVAEVYGRSQLPYESFLIGEFEEYKDPGHLVGKGWMELRFTRMFLEPDTIIPVDTRVVGVRGYAVDKEGRILGKGHPVRDTVEWMIPILWPIDLINLPRRGPRPTLRGETRLMLKVMQDMGIPDSRPMQQEPSGLYRRSPSSYTRSPGDPSFDVRPIASAPESDSEFTDEFADVSAGSAPGQNDSVVRADPAYLAPALRPDPWRPAYVSPRSRYSQSVPSRVPRVVVIYRNGIIDRLYVP